MGISFDVGTRALSGTPTAVAFGIITIRASNSEGSGDWTVAYSTAAPPVAPPIPTFLLEVDWGNDGTFSHPDADVSGDVVARHGIYCERGRGGHGSILYDQSRAGVLRVVLRNDDRKYDAISAESALGSLVTSQRLVRFSMSYPGVALTVLWTGYLDHIRPVERRSRRDELSMRALGLITLLNEARPLVTSVANDTIGGAARRVAEAAVPGIDTSLIVSTRSLVRWFKVPDETAAEAEFELERTEAGFFYEARDGRPVLETRNHRITASQTSTLTIADDGTGDVPTSRSSLSPAPRTSPMWCESQSIPTALAH